MNKDWSKSDLFNKLEEALARIKELEAENRLLKEQIAVLSKNSSTSSKPPSSDITKPKSKRRKPGVNKQGGQKGHKGKTRNLLSIESVDHLIEHKLSSCPECNLSHDESSASEGKVLRHQFFEIPQNYLQAPLFNRLSMLGVMMKITQLYQLLNALS